LTRTNLSGGIRARDVDLPPFPFDLAAFGVSRLADQGDMVPFGLSVWSAIRPAARSFCVTNGKSIDSEHARLTAFMEAVECACAETADRLIEWYETPKAMAAKGHRVVPFQTCLSVAEPDRARIRELGWIRGESLSDNSPIWAPYELVGLDHRISQPWDRNAFLMSSIGLAAHTTRESAILNAILELVEADAQALALRVAGRFAKCMRYAPETIPDPDLQCLIDRLSDRSLRLELVDITSDTGLACLGALLEDQRKGNWGHRTAGFACRPSFSEAAQAAIFEAVQSFVTTFVGARDDIVPADFQGKARPGPTGGETRPFPSDADSKPKTLEVVLAHLAAVGIDDAFVFDLAPDFPDVDCVRVIIPGLEPSGLAFANTRRGPRFASAMLAGIPLG